MYVIAVYDCNQKRVGKMLKLCRRYLTWIQNSVLEGELTKGQLDDLKIKAAKIMNKDEDSLIIFTNNNPKWLHKEILGLEKNSTDNFL